ncbi:hypothetical protein GALMADRAFT_1203829 [Galerina marginata CBS 339.88]|uniref:Uncharacterized protein n=1 Tax=Galerina marginata (strain CBS 339.88) TaxID=685588 RepID=A0A067SEJ8_GALM3|nr:hypothetical protein GALMADRAFT_1203829 [Galerina marginata CBS 339.88]
MVHLGACGSQPTSIITSSPSQMQRRNAGRGTGRMRTNPHDQGAESSTRTTRSGAPYPPSRPQTSAAPRRSTRRRGLSRLESTNSHFQGSRNVSISGGQFNSTLGNHTNVTINLNQTEPAYAMPNSGPLAAGASSSAHVDISDMHDHITRILPTPQRSNQIYEWHMLLKGRGFPLWIPEPSMNLPMPYQRLGINIGDVGIITSAGNFSFLFNICLPADHPINPRTLPEGFAPISPSIDPVDVRRFSELKPGGYLASASIERSKNSAASGELSFETQASEGAILAFPEGATSQDYENLPHFRTYVAEHLQNWYLFANGPRGRDAKNGDLRVVIGFDKTASWGMATLANISQERKSHLKFKSMERSGTNSLGCTYTWEYSGIAEVRAGPSPDEVDELRRDDPSGTGSNVKYTNQCLFVRTLNPKLDDDLWEKVNRDLGLSPVKDSNNSQSQEAMSQSSGPPTLSSISTRESLHGAYSQGPLSDTQPGITFSLTPDKTSFHPSDILNTMLLKMMPTAKTVITHDEVWCSALSESDSSLPDATELLRRILTSHDLRDEDGIAYLEPKIPRRPQRRAKRTLDSVDDHEGAEIDRTPVPLNGSPPAAKKRAIENVNAVDRTSTLTGTTNKPLKTMAPSKFKQRGAGAPVGRPDIDATFLEAIASKKAKAVEDEDDPEFPKIRIRKDETERRNPRPEEEWAVLADFGDESAPRGNFMVVVELEPYTSGRHKSLSSLSKPLDRKSDFKKFRKSAVGGSTAKVDVFFANSQ